MQLIAENKCFAGRQLRYQHPSAVLGCDMVFSVYLPPYASSTSPVPVIYWLSGLTCTDQNFVQKAGAQQYAAQFGVAIVAPDTSPRGAKVPTDPDGHFGLGASFYVDATQAPWAEHYQMYSYVTEELPALVEQHIPATEVRAIMGHSMGGHGALIAALNKPKRYTSVSAFAPICNPSNSPWGAHAFTQFLGGDKSLWQKYDASMLIASTTHKIPLRIDQGSVDEFLDQKLMPQVLLAAAKDANYPVEYHLHKGYDHSYFFIASFIGEHIAFHAEHLHKV